MLRRAFELMTDAATSSPASSCSRTARRSPTRRGGHLRGGVPALVRRRGGARIPASSPPPRSGRTGSSSPPTDRRGRPRHALELPRRDADPQDRPGARRWLHRRLQAGSGDAPHGPRPRELLDEAGTPPGVVNVVPSNRSSSLVGAMLADQRVRKLSFTGSTEVGRAAREPRPTASSTARWSSAATRPSSSSTTPISTPPSPGRWSPRCATAAKPAPPPTASTSSVGRRGVLGAPRRGDGAGCGSAPVSRRACTSVRWSTPRAADKVAGLVDRRRRRRGPRS